MNYFKNKGNLISKLNSLLLMALIAFFSFGSVSCGPSAKVLAEQQRLADEKKKAEELAKKTAKAKADLVALLNDNTKTAEEKQRILDQIKGLGVDNAEISDLIRKNEEKISEQKIAEEKKRAEDDARKKAEDEKRNIEVKTGSASEYFEMIANAPDVNTANQKIEEALKLFDSPDAPIFLIVSKVGKNKADWDYDKPIKVKEFLNYLKDKKNYDKKVDSFEVDKNNKIKSLDLIKK
ncbi:MAG: hypothetical protein EAZ97_10450 [Bacteroidetes bacterium]|nr:MAG: hypothetical protein EAZ97_10450 [Bacteroidota bacterium]